jgi:hypothetical protein
MAKSAQLGKPGIFELKRYRALSYWDIAYSVTSLCEAYRCSIDALHYPLRNAVVRIGIATQTVNRY